jgi:hypothetical protein
MRSTLDFALLAPIPEVHLISGVEAIAAQLDAENNDEKPKVVFGSMAFEVFRQADELRRGSPVNAFIYASDSKEDQPLNPEVSWRAVYVQQVPSRNGRYRGNPLCRPSSTLTDKAIWAIYWEVVDLERLKNPIPIGNLRGLKQKSDFKPRFIPEGPVLIDYPKRKN